MGVFALFVLWILYHSYGFAQSHGIETMVVFKSAIAIVIVCGLSVWTMTTVGISEGLCFWAVCAWISVCPLLGALADVQSGLLFLSSDLRNIPWFRTWWFQWGVGAALIVLACCCSSVSDIGKLKSIFIEPSISRFCYSVFDTISRGFYRGRTSHAISARAATVRRGCPAIQAARRGRRPGPAPTARRAATLRVQGDVQGFDDRAGRGRRLRRRLGHGIHRPDEADRKRSEKSGLG